jgi:hypothetical protein
MNRRNFLRGLAAAVGGIALGEAIPLNRVWSFPQKIVQLNTAPLATVYYDRAAMKSLGANLIRYYYADKATGRRLTPNIRMSHYLPELDTSLFESKWPDIEVKMLAGVADAVKQQLDQKLMKPGEHWQLLPSGVWGLKAEEDDGVRES